MTKIEELYKLSEQNEWFKPKHMSMYKDMVFRIAKESEAVRRKVGAIVLTKNGSIFIGYNGTDTGEDNTCETPEFTTKDSVIHAERNALKKMLNEDVDPKGSIIFVTDSPCGTCTEDIIIKYGIAAVVYFRTYRDMSPIDMMQGKVGTFHITEDDIHDINMADLERKIEKYG